MNARRRKPMDRGALVWTVADGGQRILRRVVVGPHWQGEFEVVVLCELEEWQTVQADSRPSNDYWGEACFAWPVEAIDQTA